MRHTPQYRVSDCKNAVGKPTSVCMSAARREALKQFAYGDERVANDAVRKASRTTALQAKYRQQIALNMERKPSWSKLVVTRALAALTGAYDPAKAEALAEERAAAEALAAENNGAWDEVA